MPALRNSLPSAAPRPTPKYRRRSRTSLPRPTRATPALCKIDVELDAAQELFQLFDATPADEFAQRQDDRVGLRFEAGRRSCLLDQRLRKVERCAHIVTR